MINALPALVLALYVKRLDKWAMVAGWAAGIGSLIAAAVGRRSSTSISDDDYRPRAAADVALTGTRSPVGQPAAGTGAQPA